MNYAFTEQEIKDIFYEQLSKTKFSKKIKSLVKNEFNDHFFRQQLFDMFFEDNNINNKVDSRLNSQLPYKIKQIIPELVASEILKQLPIILKDRVTIETMVDTTVKDINKIVNNTINIIDDKIKNTQKNVNNQFSNHINELNKKINDSITSINKLTEQNIENNKKEIENTARKVLEDIADEDNYHSITKTYTDSIVKRGDVCIKNIEDKYNRLQAKYINNIKELNTYKDRTIALEETVKKLEKKDNINNANISYLTYKLENDIYSCKKMGLVAITGIIGGLIYLAIR